MKRELSLEVYSHFYRNFIPKDKPAQEAQANRTEIGGEKNKGHPYAYYRQYWPAFFLLKLFGRYPLQINKNGDYSARLVSWWMLYCVTVYSLQTYLAVIVCINRLRALVDSQSDYDEFIFSIHILAYLNIHFHVPFTYWLQAGRIAHYLKRWAQFQDDWSGTFGQPFKLTYGRRLRVFICLVGPAIFGFLVFEQYATLRDPPLHFLPYFVTLVCTSLILALWYTTCLEIRNLSDQLSDKLVQRLENRTTPWLLSRWRLLWLELRTLTEFLGSDLCAVLVSVMLTFSTTFLLGLFIGLVQLISYGPSWKTLGYICSSLSSICIILVICDGGHRAASGVVSSTLSSILKAKQSMVNQEIKHEIYLTLEAVKADPPEVKLGGFVTLNRPLVVSLVSNTLTYLIVLLQFKINEEDHS